MGFVEGRDYPAYNHFAGSFGFQLITISDSNGDVIAVAGRVELNEEYMARAPSRLRRPSRCNTSNGPGDGNTKWDWEILNPMTVNLRAERAGLLNSRIYTLWVECVDSGGQVARPTTTVTVPHDQRGK